MLSHFNPAEVFRLIETEGVASFKVVPAMATVLVNHPSRLDFDLSSLKFIYIGGSAAVPTLIQQVEEAFACDCYTLYGLTETSPVLSHARMKPELSWMAEARYTGQAKAGFAIPGTTLGIVNAEDDFLSEDGTAVGEVVARGMA